MTSFVVYQVPVLVEVDEHEGVVVSVRVEDEGVRDPVDVVDLAGGVLTDERRQRLIDVAEAASWPAWQLGVV